MFRINNFDFVFFLFSLVKVCPLLSPSPPSPPPPPPPLRGSEPLSQPVTPALRQLLFGCGALFGIHTRGKWTQQGQFLSTPRAPVGGQGGGGCKAAALVAALTLVAGELLAALGGNTWQTRDPSGKKGGAATLVNVLIVTDSQHACRSLERAVGGGGAGGGILGFYSSLCSCLSSLSLSVSSWQRERGCSLDPRLRVKE